jgi:hypothetical protein
MFSSSDWGSLLFKMIVYGTGFILGAFGGMYSECSGIINIALEGSMIVGSLCGFALPLWNGRNLTRTHFCRRGVPFLPRRDRVIVVSILFSFSCPSFPLNSKRIRPSSAPRLTWWLCSLQHHQYRGDWHRQRRSDQRALCRILQGQSTTKVSSAALLVILHIGVIWGFCHHRPLAHDGSDPVRTPLTSLRRKSGGRGFGWHQRQ